MDDETRARYEAKSAELRTELKQWENDFADRNGGKKPGRQDIKNNPNMANKYKSYNHVRDILSGKTPATPSRGQRQKREPETESFETPSKRVKHIESPSKHAKNVETPSMDRVINLAETGIFDTPASQGFFSPAMPTSIGPTPQKNGRVLGIFDLLDMENAENVPPTNDPASNLLNTPSKRRASDLDVEKLGRTPTSASKRAKFTTPSKQRTTNALDAATPHSASSLRFSTPAYLRRKLLPIVDEDGEYLSPPKPIRFPTKSLFRGLSKAVAELRKLEEEKLDDDLEALHEIENEFTGATTVTKPSAPAKPALAKILEPDSQGPQLLGGFDDEALYDSPTEEDKGRDGLPLKVYKKKGQKRTTRRVNMRPTRTKRPEAAEATADEAEEEDEEVVPETQAKDAEELDPDVYYDIPDESEDESPKAKKTGKKASPKEKAEPKKKEGKVQKVVKKVNELAHANFKRLKLRNTGSKGGPGYGSRFRRRK